MEIISYISVNSTIYIWIFSYFVLLKWNGENMKNQFESKNCEECTDKAPMFLLLKPEELRIIDKDRFTVNFRPGEIIVKQGTTSSHVISLVAGFAKIYIESHFNRNLILNFIKPWKILGGPGIYTDNRHHYSVLAIEASRVCFIDIQNFKEVLRKNYLFAEAFISYLNQKSIYTFERLISLTQKQMPGRIADGLLYLSKEVYNNTCFNTTISRQDFADFTAMSKDSAIRILKDFERDQIITLKGKEVCILDMDQLKEISLKG